MRSLKRRIASLRNLELFNALFLPLVFRGLWWTDEGQTFGARGVGMALVSSLLIQGRVYWHLKLRSIETRTSIAAGHLLVFQRLGRANVAALTLATLGISLAGLFRLVTPQDAWWGLFLTGFA